MNNNIFLENLIQHNIISEENLQKLLEEKKEELFDILLYLEKEETCDKHLLGKLWGDYIKKSYTNLAKVVFDESVINEFPENVAKEYNVIPLYRFGAVLTLVSSKPQNPYLIDKLEKIIEHRVSLVFSFPDDINTYIEIHYSKADSLTEIFPENSEKSPDKINDKYVTIKQTSDSNESIISEETKQYLVNNVKEIQNDIENDKTPNVLTCKKISSKITEEMYSKFDLIQCINQLRISDEYTYSHSINVAMLSSAMGKSLGFSENLVKELTFSALLHDIGKLKIPKIILNKPTKLNKDEFELVKKHSQFGYDLLKQMNVSNKVAEVALNHHERLNGLGYPNNLKQEELSLNTQIVSIIDVYDALLSERAYKKAISSDKALNLLLLEGRGPLNYDLLYKFVSLVYKKDFQDIKTDFKEILY